MKLKKDYVRFAYRRNYNVEQIWKFQQFIRLNNTESFSFIDTKYDLFKHSISRLPRSELL